jgi:hypothetical protein
MLSQPIVTCQDKQLKEMKFFFLCFFFFLLLFFLFFLPLFFLFFLPLFFLPLFFLFFFLCFTCISYQMLVVICFVVFLKEWGRRLLFLLLNDGWLVGWLVWIATRLRRGCSFFSLFCNVHFY